MFRRLFFLVLGGGIERNPESKTKATAKTKFQEWAQWPSKRNFFLIHRVFLSHDRNHQVLAYLNIVHALGMLAVFAVSRVSVWLHRYIKYIQWLIKLFAESTPLTYHIVLPDADIEVLSIRYSIDILNGRWKPMLIARLSQKSSTRYLKKLNILVKSFIWNPAENINIVACIWSN